MIASTYHLGIDVGSTTAKAVVFDPLAQRVLFSRYVRHNAHQVETVASLLRTVAKEFPECSFRLITCGSGGTTIADVLGVPFVQEVVANSLAVRRDHENVRCAIELGGQDAKMVFFERDEKSGATTVADMRMNGSCAGGTGAFIDEMAALLKVPVEQFDELAARGQSVHQVSGRCGVYAKTDIQPLLNQGVSKEDLALSSFHAIAKQTIGGLAQGLDIHPPVIFEGGPLTFNPTLVRVFAERLELADDDIVIPQNPETIVALGAALAADELFADNENCLVANLLDAADALDKAAASPAPSTRGTTYFTSDEERAAWKASHALAPQTPPDPAPGSTVRAYLGIDSGSTTTKFALVSPDGKLVQLVLRPQRRRASRRRPYGTHRAARPLSRSGCHARHPGRGNHWLRRAHVRESLRRRLPHGRDRGACPRGGSVRARCELRVGHRRAGHEGPMARWRHHHRHCRERGLLIGLRIVS